MLAEGDPPGEGYQAHHGLPWHYVQEFSKVGININDPQYGRWVKGGGNGGHQSWSRTYDQLWWKYFKRHDGNYDKADIIDYFNRLNGVR